MSKAYVVTALGAIVTIGLNPSKLEDATYTSQFNGCVAVGLDANGAVLAAEGKDVVGFLHTDYSNDGCDVGGKNGLLSVAVGGAIVEVDAVDGNPAKGDAVYVKDGKLQKDANGDAVGTVLEADSGYTLLLK